MVPVMAGFFGLGGPEVLALIVLGLIIYVVASLLRRNITRFCPKCGRGLTQAADAPFCAYCGERLP